MRDLTKSAGRNPLTRRLACIRNMVSFSIIAGVAAQASTSAQEPPIAAPPTALDRYVAANDDSYAWKIVRQARSPGAETFVVEMTSQSWRKNDEVDRTIWKHWLVIVKPDQVRSQRALLFVGGGRNGTDQPSAPDDRTLQIALATNSVVARLGMVPNQPLMFHNDGKPRYEDDLIAYAWDQFLKSGDPHWLPRLPMVKSVVRAMDTTQSLLAGMQGGQHRIDQFVVAGGSKRGWTTWMTAAVDGRVCAIIPIVIDVVNVKLSMQHHYSAYGYWAPAVDDYVNHKIMQRRNTARYAKLLKLVDPFAYRSRFTMPKCVINATGDEYFLPDSSQFYFDDLPGEKHLCYVPNANHSLRGTDALDTLIAFYHAILNDVPRPQVSWEFEGPNRIRVHAQTRPERVTLWKATNPKDRDFRIDTIGPAYEPQQLEESTQGDYIAEVATPGEGWTAYFAQLEFEIGGPTKLRLTTPVRVVPDVLPHADKRAPEID